MDVIVSVPKGSKSAYESADIWKSFWNIREYSDDGTEAETKKCDMPSISYYNGKLIFATNTEGATCHSSITDSDIASYNENEVSLVVTYIINVYATKPGYENSEVATATLCWIDVEPKSEGLNDDITQVRACAVFIQTENGNVTITGTDDGTTISVYGTNGLQVGSAVSHNGYANIHTNLQSGSIAIVKIGDRSIKVPIK